MFREKLKKNQKLIIVNDANASQVSTKTNKRFWNFIPGLNEEEVELSIYGEIVSTESWWDSSGEVAYNNFIQELDSYKDKDAITVRINSNGGDVFAAAAIYTRLMDMKATIKVKIDGMCMSAATIIAMAGESEISPCGMFMTHGPLVGLSGYYKLDDLEQYKVMLEKIKDIIINAYAKKTGKTKDELKSFVDSENYMTADESVENGFIDKIMFEEDVNPVIDKNLIIINKVSFDLSNIPSDFKNKFKNIIEKNSVNNSQSTMNVNSHQSNIGCFFNTNLNDSGDDEMIKNAQELKEKYSNVYKEVVDKARESERNRIKNIDELPGDDSIKNKAKYDEIIDAGECAMKILNAQKSLGNEYLKNRESDAKGSGANEVNASAAHQSNIAKDGYNYDETNAILDKALGTAKGGVR